MILEQFLIISCIGKMGHFIYKATIKQFFILLKYYLSLIFEPGICFTDIISFNHLSVESEQSFIQDSVVSGIFEQENYTMCIIREKDEHDEKLEVLNR